MYMASTCTFMHVVLLYCITWRSAWGFIQRSGWILDWDVIEQSSCHNTRMPYLVDIGEKPLQYWQGCWFVNMSLRAMRVYEQCKCSMTDTPCTPKTCKRRRNEEGPRCVRRAWYSEAWTVMPDDLFRAVIWLLYQWVRTTCLEIMCSITCKTLVIGDHTSMYIACRSKLWQGVCVAVKWLVVFDGVAVLYEKLNAMKRKKNALREEVERETRETPAEERERLLRQAGNFNHSTQLWCHSGVVV